MLNSLLYLLIEVFVSVLQILRFILFSMIGFVDTILRSRAAQFLFKLSIQAFIIIGAISLALKFIEYLALLFRNKNDEASKLKESMIEYYTAFKYQVQNNLPGLLKKIAIGALFGAALLTFNIVLLTTIQIMTPGLLGMASVMPSLSTRFVNSVLYAPIFEEIVFRYMLIEGMKKIGNAIHRIYTSMKSSVNNIFGFKGAEVQLEPVSNEQQVDKPGDKEVPSINKYVVASALLFSAGHTGGLGQNIATLLGGLMLGRLYEEYDGDLTAPVAAHMANNGIVHILTRSGLRI